MGQTTKSATEYYALLYEDVGELDDIDEYIDYEERVVELAVGAVYIGELTDEQFPVFLKRCRREYKMRSFEYTVKFIEKQSIPPYKETELKSLFAGLSIDRQEILDTVFDLAHAVRKASGCEGENIIKTIPQPATAKETKSKKGTPSERQKKGTPSERQRAERTKPADLMKAVKEVIDNGITQREAEIQHGIPQGALSKGKGLEIMEKYQKLRQGKQKTIDGHKGVSKKEIEKGILSADLRRTKEDWE